MRVLFCSYAPIITPGVFFLGPSHRAVLFSARKGFRPMEPFEFQSSHYREEGPRPNISKIFCIL